MVSLALARGVHPLCRWEGSSRCRWPRVATPCNLPRSQEDRRRWRRGGGMGGGMRAGSDAAIASPPHRTPRGPSPPPQAWWPPTSCSATQTTRAPVSSPFRARPHP